MTADDGRRTLEAAVLRVTIDGTPVPASRPRVTDHGTYYNGKYKQWKEAVASLIRDGAIKQLGAAPHWTERVSVLIDFYKPRANADIDNLIKGVLDALQAAGVFVNDKQVRHVTASITEESSAPRTEIYVERWT